MPFSPCRSFSLVAKSMLLVLSISILFTAGCGMGTSAPAGSGLGSVSDGVGISGKAYGGGAPIVGAYAFLYQSQNNGYGGNAALVSYNTPQSGGHVDANGINLTGNNGEFSFPFGAACTPGSLLYVTLYAGNSGATGVNGSILEMAPYGICGTAGLTASTGSSLYISELTTTAAAYALGNFITIANSTSAPIIPVVNVSVPPNNNATAIAGATPVLSVSGATPTGATCSVGATFIAAGSNDVSTGTTCTASGLAHAFSNYTNLVDSTQYSGSARNVTPTNANSAVPAALLNTIADILQGCVNSTGVNPTLIFPAGTGSPSASSVTAANPSDTLGGTIGIIDTPIVGSATTTYATVTSGSTLAQAVTQINAAAKTTNTVVTNIAVTNGGSGYTTAPLVAIGGPGSGATATATVVNGVVASITLTAGGTGYSAAPAVIIAAPASGATATATAFVTDNVITASTTGAMLTITANNSTDAITFTGTASNQSNLIDTSSPAPTSTCNSLMTAVPSLAGVTPTNTLQAAINLAKNPTASIFTLLPPSSANAFSPVLSGAPNDWTVAVSYLVPLPNASTSGLTVTSGNPYMIDLDANDTAYTATEANGDQLVTGTGTEQDGCLYSVKADGTDNYSGVTACYAIPITTVPKATATNYLNVKPDALGNLWVPNANGSGTTALGFRMLQFSALNPGTPTQYTPAAGTTRMGSVGVDKANNVYFGANSTTAGQQIQELAISAGPTWTAGSVGGSFTLMDPMRDIELDITGNLWLPELGSGNGQTTNGGNIGLIPAITAGPTFNQTSNPVIETAIAGGAAAHPAANSVPYGVAIDASGDGWVSNNAFGTGFTVSEISKIVPTYNTATPAVVTAVPVATVTITTVTQPKEMEVDGANNLWVVDTTGNHEFTSLKTTPTEVSPSGGFKPCFLGYQGTATACIAAAAGTGSYDTTGSGVGGSRNLAIDSAGDVWYLFPTSTDNSTTTQEGRIFEIIGSAYPTWPLKAQQTPAIPAGCTKTLANGCN